MKYIIIFLLIFLKLSSTEIETKIMNSTERFIIDPDNYLINESIDSIIADIKYEELKRYILHGSILLYENLNKDTSTNNLKSYLKSNLINEIRNFKDTLLKYNISYKNLIFIDIHSKTYDRYSCIYFSTEKDIFLNFLISNLRTDTWILYKCEFTKLY